MCSIDRPLALLCARVMYYVSVFCLTPALQGSANMLMFGWPFGHWSTGVALVIRDTVLVCLFFSAVNVG